MDGTIRVWYPEFEENFFGEEYVFEKRRSKEEYIKVAV